MDTGQEPFVNISEETIREALKLVIGIITSHKNLDLFVLNFIS